MMKMYLYLFIVTAASTPVSLSLGQTTRMFSYESSSCPGKVLNPLDKLCVTNARSKLNCAVQCGQNSNCKSFDFDSKNRRCHLGVSAFLTNCANAVTATSGTIHYEQEAYCLNGGDMKTNGSCICPNATIGSRCERIMTDCIEWATVIATGSGIYWIQPLSAVSPFQVMCRTGGGNSRLYIMSHDFTSSTSFNRDWAAYRDGFGSLQSGDFWLGLEKLHLVTNGQNYSFKFHLVLLDGTEGYRTYDYFRVAGEERNYKFDAVPSDKSSGSLRLLDDCLSSLINTSFSTFDKDNDGDDNVTCASTYQSGWWFKGPSCARCNPTGLKPQSVTAVNIREAFWGNIVPAQLFAYLVPN